MTIKRCPKCRRIDKVAKVTAIVVNSTQRHNSSTSTAEPTFSGDGIEFSFSLENTASTTRTALAQTLSFPHRSTDRVQHAWGAFAGFGIMAVVFGFALSDMIEKDVSLAPLQPLSQGSITMAVFTLACALGAIISLLVAIDATVHDNKGRQARALSIWNRLYYCFRDDYLYIPDDPSAGGSPDEMRQILQQ